MPLSTRPADLLLVEARDTDPSTVAYLAPHFIVCVCLYACTSAVYPLLTRFSPECFWTGRVNVSLHVFSSLMKCLLYSLGFLLFFTTHGGCSNEAAPEIAVGLVLQNYDIPCENLPKSQWLQPCVRFLYL